jgi:hypothetical protein
MHALHLTQQLQHSTAILALLGTIHAQPSVISTRVFHFTALHPPASAPPLPPAAAPLHHSCMHAQHQSPSSRSQHSTTRTAGHMSAQPKYLTALHPPASAPPLLPAAGPVHQLLHACTASHCTGAAVSTALHPPALAPPLLPAAGPLHQLLHACTTSHCTAAAAQHGTPRTAGHITCLAQSDKHPSISLHYTHLHQPHHCSPLLLLPAWWPLCTLLRCRVAAKVAAEHARVPSEATTPARIHKNSRTV